MALVLQALPSRADDTDLFNQPPGTNPAAPNIIFILDNTSNWSRAAQQWVGSSTAGDAEILAIKNFVAGLTQPANVGLIEFTTAGHTGGYVRYGVRNMTISANNTALQNIVSGINVNSPSEKVNQSSGGIANTLYETWLYLNGSSSWAGMDGSADYAGNTGFTPAGQSLRSGFAYKGSSINSAYNSPIGTNCAKTYIIFIGNNGPAASPAAPSNTDPSSTTLSTYSYTTTPDVQSAWTRFLHLRPDLARGSLAAANGSVTTYTIDAYNAQQNTDYTTVLKNMAQLGGGKYYQAGSDASLQANLQNILAQIQAVNSVFASASLPVSVSARGTYLNQVYLGVFRPDANAQPNWVGNLKQYKLGVDTTVSPPNLFMADSLGAAAENPTTGFVNPSATSFWTQASTFWNPMNYANSQGVGGSSDSPDGDLVEKGGAAQYLRSTFAFTQAARNLYTCTGTCATGSVLSSTPFTVTNSAITNASLGAASISEHDAIINWVRGGNANQDDPAPTYPGGLYTTTLSTTIRGFAHGDVLHARPAVINYGRTTDDIVAYYGANDGILHAVKGGQALANGDGKELWGFLAPEHFSQLKRMRDHTPIISESSPKPYFMDGSPTSYTFSSANDGKIDYTRGDKAYLFIPMRRGGRFIYALDVSNPLAPTFLWKHSSADTGFAELGQSWSDMRVAKLRYQTNPVLVFGLGYDAAANDPAVQRTATMGRGLMVLDATTGNPIWQAGLAPVGAPINKIVAGMTYAIPAAVALYDSDGDGNIDRIYAGDTGGNVWRIDVNDASPANWTVNQLASLGGTGSNARKFLYPPDIVPADTTNKFDSVLLGSGDREHPFDTSILNRYYMVKDDHGLTATTILPIVEGLAGSTSGIAGQLYDATSNVVQEGTSAQIAAAKTAFQLASGWYMRLGTGEKVVGGSTTLAGTVYFGTNAPAPVADNACVGNLGQARLYAISYLNGSATSDQNQTGTLTALDRFVTRAGGGYPPTPVPISVVISGKTYQGAISGTQILTSPGPTLNRRYRTFWQQLIDKN
ncbi:MAG: pilus assembly protein PilY [Candidatus Saccharibacteria bacterium]|nr:pilus assembly protein PilY [Rhodoferax sp.]